jgi:O-antigen/teichoic acid export membrane protein
VQASFCDSRPAGFTIRYVVVRTESGARPESGAGVASPPARDPSGDSAPHSSLILTNVGLRAFADVAGKLASAALYILVARKVGASEYGVFVFALSFVGIVVTFGQLGQDTVLVREVARDHRRLDEYYSNALLSRVFFSVPPLLIALAVAALVGTKGHTELVLAFLGLGFVGDALVRVSFGAFQAYERLGFIPVVLISQRWLTTIAAAVALYLGGGIVAVSAIYCVGALGATALAAWLLFRRVARPRLHVDLRGIVDITRVGLPIGLASIGLIVLSRIDMTMLASYKPSAAVGQYGAAYRLLDTTAFVPWAVSAAVLPTLSRLSPRTPKPVGAVYARSLKLVLAITLPMAVGAALLAGPLISLLYGSGYSPGATALLLLAASIVLYPISACSAELFYSQGVQRAVAVTYAVVLVENVLANLFLIPRFSLNGAAAGTSISEGLVAVSLLILSRPLHGKLNVGRILTGPVLASAGAAGVMGAFHDELAVAIPLGIATYLALLITFERLAFPDDFAVLRLFLRSLTARRPRRVPSAPPP